MSPDRYDVLLLLQEASVFLFDKRTADKLHKPRRKETIAEMLRHGVRQLERCRHPRLLHVLHSVEETTDTLAFATEPVSTSLGNVLAAAEDRAAAQDADSPSGPVGATEPSGQNGQQQQQTVPPPPGTTVTKDGIKVAELPFLDIEIKYGLLQVIKQVLERSL